MTLRWPLITFCKKDRKPSFWSSIWTCTKAMEPPSFFQNEPRVFTFSMHGRNNYPLHKEKSDLDVALEDGCPDNRYLELLNGHLDALFDRLRPELVFFQSGVDVLATDKLGRLGLSLNGCRERDALVFSRCARAGIPVTVCMGGGYSEKLSDILEAHVQTFEEARKAFG